MWTRRSLCVMALSGSAPLLYELPFFAFFDIFSGLSDFDSLAWVPGAPTLATGLSWMSTCAFFTVGCSLLVLVVSLRWLVVGCDAGCVTGFPAAGDCLVLSTGSCDTTLRLVPADVAVL